VDFLCWILEVRGYPQRSPNESYDADLSDLKDLKDLRKLLKKIKRKKLKKGEGLPRTTSKGTPLPHMIHMREICCHMKHLGHQFLFLYL
jgi:hypothetical protein